MKNDIKNKLVGRIDDEYYICDYLFNDECCDNFKGAVGTGLRPISKEEYEERTSPESIQEYLEENWRQAVAQGFTTDGLEEFADGIVMSGGDETIFDFSGYDYWNLLREAEPKLTEEDYPVFECVSGGQCFSSDMKFDKVYDKKLWQQIKEIEK